MSGLRHRCFRIGRREGIGVALLTLFVGLMFSSCTESGEEARVRDLIAEGTSRAEARDLRGLHELTDGGFRGHPGNRSWEEVAEVLAAAFYHYRKFRILHPRPTVELSDDRSVAIVTFPFLIVREPRTYPGLDELTRDPRRWVEAVGENADLYHLVLELAQSGGEWRARAATLTPYGRPGFSPMQ